MDGCEVLRAGATAAILGHAMLAPSTIGTFLRGFSWGHARQLDTVAGEAVARAWAVGAGLSRASRSPTTWTVQSTKPSRSSLVLVGAADSYPGRGRRFFSLLGRSQDRLPRSLGAGLHSEASSWWSRSTSRLFRLGKDALDGSRRTRSGTSNRYLSPRLASQDSTSTYRPTTFRSRLTGFGNIWARTRVRWTSTKREPSPR